MKISYFVLGDFMTNVYIVYDEKTMDGLVIDPTFHPEKYIRFIRETGITPKSIFLTHAHVDHMAGMNELRDKYPDAKLYMCEKDRPYLTDTWGNLSAQFGMDVVCKDADVWVKDGDVIDTCGLSFKVLETPGHTPGSISFYCADEKIVFTGDSLFQGSIGRTDFPGGSMTTLVTSIKEKIFTLPDKTVVLSGHGDPTSVEIEKKYNPFLAGM